MKSGHRIIRGKLEHVRVAEKALGKLLPKGAVVHHVDGDPANNQGDNLVVCPNQAYHILIHQRQRALEACGHADWLICKRCGQYDSPENLSISGKGRETYHRACAAQYQRNRAQRKRFAAAASAALKEEQ